MTEEEIRCDERRKVAEEIARAIEVAEGRRCPECGGLAASSRHVGGRETRRCGGGHMWVTPPAMLWPAEIARKHALAPAVSRG